MPSFKLKAKEEAGLLLIAEATLPPIPLPLHDDSSPLNVSEEEAPSKLSVVPSHSDSQGGTLTSTHDDAGRLDVRTLSSSHGTMEVDLSYTPQNRIDDIDRSSPGAGTFRTEQDQDLMGRVTQTRHYGNGTHFTTISVTYDPGGRVHAMDDAYGEDYVKREMSYLRQWPEAGNKREMGSMNRLAHDEDWSYTWHDEGNLQERREFVTFSEADLWEYEYDHANRLVKMGRSTREDFVERFQRSLSFINANQDLNATVEFLCEDRVDGPSQGGTQNGGNDHGYVTGCLQVVTVCTGQGISPTHLRLPTM